MLGHKRVQCALFIGIRCRFLSMHSMLQAFWQAGGHILANGAARMLRTAIHCCTSVQLQAHTWRASAAVHIWSWVSIQVRQQMLLDNFLAVDGKMGPSC